VRCVLASLFGRKTFPLEGQCGRDFRIRESWPHAPPHFFTPRGTYIITAATLHRKPLFGSSAKLTLLRNTTFELAQNYVLILQAWAFFANHYHLVMSFENTARAHRDFVKHLRRELAIRLNPSRSHPRSAGDV
jgi:REP element-mobilizing transposase RayT